MTAPIQTPKAKKVLTPVERDIASIRHAVSTDPARIHINTPFASGGYIVGTDGHRLAAVKSEKVPTDLERQDAPAWQQIVPWDAPLLGQLQIGSFEDTRAFPGSWSVGVILKPEDEPEIFVSKRMGKKRSLYPFGRSSVRVPWPAVRLEFIKKPICIELSYLLDALEFCLTGTIEVYGSPTDDLAPLAFAPCGQELRKASRIAVVMPRVVRTTAVC